MCKVKFIKNCAYAMEEHHVRTIPPDIEFDAEIRGDGVVILTAPGFGQRENYGNGSLISHLWRKTVSMDRDVPAEIRILRQDVDEMCELLKLSYGFTTTDNSLLPEKIKAMLKKHGKWIKEE